MFYYLFKPLFSLRLRLQWCYIKKKKEIILIYLEIA